MYCAKRTLRIESLEQKQLLAGDVAVNVLNGVLTLEGDELDNQVVVSSGEVPGTFVIRGLEGTQLLSGVADPVTEVVVEGVRHGLRASLGEGNDLLRIVNSSIRGNVAINMGTGDDRVAIGVLPEMSESDLDVTESPNVKLGANLAINLGAGNDMAVIQSTVARGALHIVAGEGDDIVRLGRPEETTEEETASIVEGEMDRPEFHFRRGVQVRLGDGDDSFAANGLHVNGLGLNVNGGLGTDSIRVVETHAPILSLDGGQGESSDRVSIQDSATRLLFVGLGGGDDMLSLGGVKTQLALLYGGPGEADTLTLLGENMIRQRRVTGFEIRNPSEEAAQVA